MSKRSILVGKAKAQGRGAHKGALSSATANSEVFLGSDSTPIKSKKKAGTKASSLPMAAEVASRHYGSANAPVSVPLSNVKNKANSQSASKLTPFLESIRGVVAQSAERVRASSENEAIIAHLRRELAEKISAISDLERQQSKLAQDLILASELGRAQNDDLVPLQSTIDILRQELAGKDRLIEEINHKITTPVDEKKYMNEISTRDEFIAALNRDLGDYKAIISKKDDEINRLGGLLSEQEVMRSCFVSTESSLQEAIDILRQEVEEKDRLIEDVNSRYPTLKNQEHYLHEILIRDQKISELMSGLFERDQQISICMRDLSELKNVGSEQAHEISRLNDLLIEHENRHSQHLVAEAALIAERDALSAAKVQALTNFELLLGKLQRLRYSPIKSMFRWLTGKGV